MMTQVSKYVRWLLVVFIFLGGFIIGYKYGQERGIAVGKESGLAEGRFSGMRQGMDSINAAKDRKQEQTQSAVLKDINPFKESVANPFDKTVVNPFKEIKTNPFK